ncbi:MAG: hypothetical protein M3Q45_00100 [Chloroflexota bacterium]|nr:hypothetical protein [Chloroflexota bacterium]
MSAALTEWLSPALLLGALLSIGYASLYHLWAGRHLRGLLMALLVSGVGFYAGHLIGVLTPSMLQVGRLHALEATVGAWVALVVMHLLQQRTV